MLAGTGRQEQKARRPDRVRGEDDHARRLEVLRALAVDPGRAGRKALGIGLNLADTRAGDQFRAESDRLRPMGQVGRGLRALVAARLAGAPLDARPPAVVRGRVDRVELGPPVPTELGHPASDLHPRRPDRKRWHRRVLGVGRVGRVARESRHAELPIGPVEVGQELEVVDRPIVGHTIERSNAEVGRQGTRPGAGEDDRGATHRVVHQRGNRGVILDDRVVLGQAADVRAGGPVLAGLQLPVELVARVIRPIEPLALLEADDLEAGLREAETDDTARRAGTDDQDVCGFHGHGRLLLRRDGLPTSSRIKQTFSIGAARTRLRAPRGRSRDARAGQAVATGSSRPTSTRTSVRCARSASPSGISGRRTWAASITPRIRRHSLSRTR